MKVGHKIAYQCTHFVLFSSRNKKSPQLIVLLSHYFFKLSPLHLGQLNRRASFPWLTEAYAPRYQTSCHNCPPPQHLYVCGRQYFASALQTDDNRLVTNSTTDVESSVTTLHATYVFWVFLSSNIKPEARNMTRVQ